MHSMKTIIWLPTLLLEWLKSHLLPYEPSSEAVRVVEQASRNELRLAAYKTKRAILGEYK